jgi:prephenate dehydrogenase
MTVQITVVGLGKMGTSIGLGLAAHTNQVSRVGHDREPLTAREAQGKGAFDQIHFNLPNAVKNADIVILAEPVDEIEETLRFITQDLKPGAVVLNTAPIHSAFFRWAHEVMPAERYFLSFTPIINAIYLEETKNGVGGAHVDLFKDSLVIISNPPGMEGNAIKLATDLASMLGCSPYFADPLEADGLLAAAEILPGLVAAALVNTTMQQPGWSESRKIAGHSYTAGTEPVNHLTETKKYGAAARLNHENVVRMLDFYIFELQTLRTAILQDDDNGLHIWLEKAFKGRSSWLNERYSAAWNHNPMTGQLPTSGEVMGRLIGLGRKKDKSKFSK